MVPKLQKQMQWGYDGNHLNWDTDKRCGYEEKCKQIEKLWNALSQGTGQIEFLAAMMHHMFVPKDIDFVCPTMHPISLKIEDNKSDSNGNPCGFDMKKGNFLNEPFIGENGNTQAQHIFHNIGNPRK